MLTKLFNIAILVLRGAPIPKKEGGETCFEDFKLNLLFAVYDL